MANVQPIHLWMFTTALLLLAVAIVLFIFLYMRWERFTRLRKNTWTVSFSDLVTLIIFCESNDELNAVLCRRDMEALLRRYLRNRQARKVLAQELHKIHKALTGKAAQNVRWLFAELGFTDDIMKQFYSGKWWRKTRAIQELASMQQSQHLTRIYKCTNDQSWHVRVEAQLALVKLTGAQGLRFLNVARYPLTGWQQLCLLQELSLHTPPDIANVRAWLTSENETVVEFAHKLSRQYASLFTADEAFVYHESTVKEKHDLV